MALFDSENNVGQFGADNSNIIRYKQAAEYAEDARLYALAAAEAVVDADNLMNRAEELLQEAQDILASVQDIQEQVDQLEEDVAAAQATIDAALAEAQEAVDQANAAIAQAQASQAAAAASATAAAGSASTATTQATNAANSASAANTSAGNASTSATNAANSATAAQTQADRASSEADRAQAAADSIDTDAIEAQIATKANKGANSDITSITGLTTALAVNQGGTGATTAINAARNLNVLPLPSANSSGSINAIITAGVYSIPSSMTDLPVASNGILCVYLIASGGAIVQDYTSVSTSSVSLNRAYRRAGLITSGVATWNEWESITMLPTEASSVDLNTYNIPGTYYGGSFVNGPSAVGNASGVITVVSNGAKSIVTQTAIYTSSGRVFTRTYASSAWNAWTEVMTTGTVVPVANGGTGTALTDGTGAVNIGAYPSRGTPPAAVTDINQMGVNSSDKTYLGVWNFSGSAQYSLTNLPEATAGMLEVFASSSFVSHQRYTTRYGAVYTRSATATWSAASPNNWGPWLNAANSIAGTFFTGDMNTLITPGEYAVTAAATNIPPTSGSAGRVIVETRTPTPTSSFGDVTQTFSAFSVATSMTNRVWKRTYQSSATSWGAWYEVTTMDLNGITRALRGVDSTLTLGADGANPLDAVSLRQMQTAIANVSSSGGINGVMSTFIGDVSWWQGSPANIPTGYVAPSGQLSLRTDYPEIWSLINAGVLSSTTDALWNSSAGNRGKFSTGTVTTGTSANFRWPDLNGAVSGTPTGVFLRGAYTGADNVGSAGEMRGPAAPNITGSFNVTPDGANVALMNNQAGAFGATGTLTAVAQIASGSGAANRTPTTNFDASRSSIVYGSGYTEIRPSSVVGLWIMRAKGTFSAQTSFNVMTSVASAPANSTTTEGGLVRSALMQGTTELGGVTMKYRHLVDASGVVSKRMVLGVTGGTGEVRIAEDGSIGIDGGAGISGGASITGDTVMNGNLTFQTAAQRRALVTHLGISGTNSRLVIPISATQAVQILCVAAAPTTNSSGDATVNFPFAFANVGNLVVSNGNGAVAMATVAVINAIRTTSFDVRAYNNGSPQVGQFQFNYVVMGLINI